MTIISHFISLENATPPAAQPPQRPIAAAASPIQAPQTYAAPLRHNPLAPPHLGNSRYKLPHYYYCCYFEQSYLEQNSYLCLCCLSLVPRSPLKHTLRPLPLTEASLHQKPLSALFSTHWFHACPCRCHLLLLLSLIHI